MFRRILGALYRSVVTPAAMLVPRELAREVLLQPRIFDLVSLLLQLRDYRRLRRIGQLNLSEGAHHRDVHSYNAGVTLEKLVTTTRRAESVYQIIALPPRNLGREELLIIGPRNAQELFIAWLYGFTWGRIRGIDLYSTNPKIVVMNMESMTFQDSVVDAVVMSNTLAYASDTFKCLSEIYRVLRPGGRLVFGATYAPGNSRWAGDEIGGSEILSMLRKLGFELYYYHPTDKVNALNKLQTVHFFGCHKPDPLAPCFDRIRW